VNNENIAGIDTPWTPDDEKALVDAFAPLVEPTDDERLLWQAREALRFTREYVHPAVWLPSVEGWSWWDACKAIDERLGRDDDDLLTLLSPAPQEEKP
jgi:hypothetical protein